MFFLREIDDFPEKEEITEYFRKNYNSAFSMMPVLNSQATRNDAKRYLYYLLNAYSFTNRNWKKEATMRQSSSQDLENSISLAELVEELDMGTNSKVSIIIVTCSYSISH